MERAAALADYARDPRGRYLAGPGWLAFCRSPQLWGFALVGAPTAPAMEALVAALSLELAPATPPHASLVDTRRLLAVEPAAFSVFERYVTAQAPRLAEKVTHLAVACAPGLAGAAVAGFFGVLAPPFPVSVVADTAAGLAALGLEDADAARALGAALDRSDAPLDLPAQVRLVFGRTPDAAPAEVARALGTTARTLQRHLTAAGTSLRAEQAAERLARALRRIEGTDESLTAIALESGFATLQHMGRAVRAATGCSPSALRMARRDHPSARG